MSPSSVDPQPAAPLRGVRVVDLSQALAGPYATALLADLGADVVKVEPPDGDHFRHLGGGTIFATVNRNKRGIVLDLKTSTGRDALRELVRTADVFLESFVPGVIDRLGFSYATVSSLRRDVVYVSISGFGQAGPYRELPGYDVVAQAMSGLMDATGEAGRPPVRTGGSMVDVGTGLYAAVAVLAALRERDRTGDGQRLEISLLETAVSLVPHFFSAYSIHGTVRKRQGSVADLGAPYQNFATRDGYVFVGCTTPRHWQALCDEFGLEALREDPRLQTAADRLTNRDVIVAVLEPLLSECTRAEAVDRLWRARIPSGPVLAVDEVMADPHLAERGTWDELEDPTHGRFVFPRTAIRWNDATFHAVTPAPRLGEHTDEVTREWGASMP